MVSYLPYYPSFPTRYDLINTHFHTGIRLVAVHSYITPCSQSETGMFLVLTSRMAVSGKDM